MDQAPSRDNVVTPSLLDPDPSVMSRRSSSPSVTTARDSMERSLATNVATFSVHFDRSFQAGLLGTPLGINGGAGGSGGFGTGVGSYRVTRDDIAMSLFIERCLRGVMPAVSVCPFFLRVTAEVTGSLSNSQSVCTSVIAASEALSSAGIPLLDRIAACTVSIFTAPSGGIEQQTERSGQTEWCSVVDAGGVLEQHASAVMISAGNRAGMTAMQLTMQRNADITPSSYGLPLEAAVTAVRTARDARIKMLEVTTSESVHGVLSKRPCAPTLVFIPIDVSDYPVETLPNGYSNSSL